MRKAKKMCLSSEHQKSKTHVRDTGEHCQPPDEDGCWV